MTDKEMAEHIHASIDRVAEAACVPRIELLPMLRRKGGGSMSWRVMNAGHYPFGFVDPPEHLTVENDTTHETVRYVPERTCANIADRYNDFECSECGARWGGFLRGAFHYCPECGAKVVE